MVSSAAFKLAAEVVVRAAETAVSLQKFSIPPADRTASASVGAGSLDFRRYPEPSGLGRRRGAEG